MPQCPYIVYYWRTLLQPLSNNRFYFFFPNFWHAKISSSFRISPFTIFVSALSFWSLICQKSDKNNNIRINFIRNIIKISTSKIYIKNAQLITRKYDINRILIKVEFVFICVQSTKTSFNHFTCNEPIGNRFQYCYRIINSFITYFLSLILIRTICY